MDEDYREVKYDECCKTCEYKDRAENEHPCDECLAEPLNLYTSKPMWYKEKNATRS